MQELRGSELHPDDKRHVLASFIHRMTVETCRQWPEFAREMRARGYRMPDRTDSEWLESTFFRVRKDGRLDRRVRHCRLT